MRSLTPSALMRSPSKAMRSTTKAALMSRAIALASALCAIRMWMLRSGGSEFDAVVINPCASGIPCGRYLRRRVMHIQDAPAPFCFPAHCHSVPRLMGFRSVELILVGIPQRVPKTLHVLQLHRVMKPGRELEISVPHILQHLFSSAKFAVRRVHHDFGIASSE